MLQGRTIRLALSTPLAVAALVSAVAGTLGIGGVVIHGAKGLLPSAIASIAPTSNHVRVANPPALKHSRKKADSSFVSTAQDTRTTGLQLVADDLNKKTVRSATVLVKRAAAQTKIHTTSTSAASSGTSVSAGESPPHFEPVRILVDGLGQLLAPKH